MRSPAVKILDKASDQLDRQEKVAEIYRKKRAIVDVIDKAGDVLRHQVTIPSYAYSDREVMDVEVAIDRDSRGIGEKTTYTVRGKLQRGSSKQGVNFPMYKLTRERVATDTMSQPVRYEILTADSDSETGWIPLALVADRRSDYENGGHFSTGAPTVEQLAQFNEQGFYADPRAGDLISEAQSILATAIDIHLVKHPRSS